MNYLEIYLLLVLASILAFVIGGVIQYKDCNKRIKLHKAIDDLKRVSREACDLTNVPIGSFIVALLFLCSLSLFVAILPVRMVYKAIMKIANK